ncbi:hypothetical protein ACRQ5Q_24445 [Bradyrhizobium sp. PMVTL-01]|uniref:hypothetical protein n=1 Tax=Bradyrhizobium sp. PMVTL-01 TaxID=3434999 RepID=UPI003F6F35D5
MSERSHMELLREIIEQQYVNHPTACGTSFGEILCWEIHSNGMTFVWLAEKWGLSLAMLGELIWDHCKRLEALPAVNHSYKAGGAARPLAEAKTFPLLVSAERLAQQIAADPDLECEAGPDLSRAQPHGEGMFDAWFDGRFPDPDGCTSHLPSGFKGDLRSAWNAALSLPSAGRDTVAFPRWWVQQARDRLFAMGKLPSGPLGDWAFLFREMLNDALSGAPPQPAPQQHLRILRDLAIAADATELMLRPYYPGEAASLHAKVKAAKEITDTSICKTCRGHGWIDDDKGGHTCANCTSPVTRSEAT